jgi:two-component system NtrC family sensor kinase
MTGKNEISGERQQPDSAAFPSTSSRSSAAGTSGRQLTHLERKESHLWRVSLLFLVLLAVALGAISWETLRALPSRIAGLAAVPVGVVVLAGLFAVYVWQKKKEVAELRGFVRGLQARAEAPPTLEQIQQFAEVLRRSQEGYRDLIDSFEDVVFALGLDGTIRAANRQFAQTFGKPFSELVGRRLDEFLEEPTAEAGKAALPRFIERRHWSGVVRVRFEKGPEGPGQVRYLDCVLQAIVKNEQVVGVAGLARDVTQQRESEAKFTELFETLQEGVYATTPDGALLDANPALVRMLGYDSKEELLAVNVNDLYMDAGQRGELVRELEQKATVRSREIVLRRKDGQAVICLDTATAIRDAAGRVLRYQGTLVDVTERREMEQRLYREQEFARRLVESFPDLIVVLDTDGRYTFVSPRSEEALGYTPEEMVGRRLGERSEPEDMVAMQQMFTDLVTGRTRFGSLDYRIRHKDGSWRVFRATASPLYDAQGKVTGVIASARDVTEVKRLEQQVIQAEKLAAMGHMIAGVTHELNNPLTAILGITDLLRDKSIDDQMRRQVELVHQQARRAAEIVQNLLAYARPRVPTKANVDLNELVRRTLTLHEYSLRVNNIKVDFVATPGLPTVIGDPSQLVQVFLNLLMNAEQAILEIRKPTETGNLRVRLGPRPDASGQGSGSVWVAFQDDGPGIPPETLPKIFDPFFTTKRPGRGTGLGLSICLAIVKEHGGAIEVEPAPGPASRSSGIEVGGGTIFRVVLPQSDASQAAAARAREAAVAATVSLDGRAILVVDGEESIRELVKTGLSLRGAQIDCAASGEEALAQFATRRYDAVLCDLRMPGITGHEFFEGWKERFGAPKDSGGSLGRAPAFIFMMGDLAGPGTLEFLRTVGARVVHKPFRIADLLAALGDALEPPTRSAP